VCKWQIAARIHYNGRNKLSNHIFGDYNDNMCNRCKRRKTSAVTIIPGSFLHADMNKDIHMVLEGAINEMIIKLEPILYRKMSGKTSNGSQCWMYN